MDRLEMDREAIGTEAGSAFTNRTEPQGEAVTAFANRTEPQGEAVTAFANGTEPQGEAVTAFANGTEPQEKTVTAFTSKKKPQSEDGITFADRETVQEEAVSSRTGNGELPSDNSPEDNSPWNTIPEDNPMQENSPKDTVPEDNPMRENSPKDTVPENNPMRENSPKDTVPENNPMQENSPKDTIPEDNPTKENSPEEEEADENHRGWFSRFIFSCAAFLLVFGIINFIYFILQMEPFGTNTVSIDDAKIQYIDFFTYFVDVLRGVRPLSYDFGNMLGGSSFGLFSYYLASPFNLLLYFFGKAGVYRFFNIAVALKLGTAGAAFAWFLQRRFEDRIRPALLLSLSMGYGLMQYSVAQSSNIMWLDGVYMLPLMLLGVYEVIHKKSVWRLALATAVCIFCNWYIAGLNCLFTGIWFLFEFLFCDRNREKQEVVVTEDYPLGSRHVKKEAPGFWVWVTDFILSSCRYIWGMVLGVVLSAVLFLPAVCAIRQGKGQYEEIKVLMEFSGDLLSAVRGYFIGAVSSRGNAALFCGGIAVFAAAALLFSGTFKLRQKIAYAALMGACFLMLQWEPAMLAFSLFKRADSYWYRYSYLVCFVLLFGAGACLSRGRKDTWSKVFMFLASVLYAAAVLKLNGIHFVDFRAQGMELVLANPAIFVTVAASVLLSILTIILLSIKKAFLPRFAAGLLLLAVTAAELGSNALMFWYKHVDDSQTLYMTYSKGLQLQLKQLRELDGGYYRIAQDRTRWHYEDDDLTAYFNDSLAQNYWSNTAYTSSPENIQLSLMWRLGYRDEAGCMLIVRDPVLASDSFLGVRYYLSSTPIKGLKRVKDVDPFNGRTVYRNPYALPMTFVYDGSKLPTMRYDNPFAYQNALFSTLSGKKTEIYRQLGWTRQNEGDKAFFRVSVPEGNYLAYGNLLWPEKMGGLMSINGADPVGYCRWMSPAAFLIRSRDEQAKSGASESLQAIHCRQKEEKAKAKSIAGSENSAYKTAEQTGLLGLFINFFKMEEEESDTAAADSTAAVAAPVAGAGNIETSDRTDQTAGTPGSAAQTAGAPEELSKSEILELRKLDLAGTAAAFDKKTLAEASSAEKKTSTKKAADKKAAGAQKSGAGSSTGGEDIRTIVFSTEKGLTFKDYQFYGLDLDALGEASQRIRAGRVKNMKITNGHIVCSVRGSQGRSLCLLVPWSKGWKAYRNGEAVHPDMVAGSMITIPLTDGKNKIELTYEIPHLKEGMYISAGAFAVLLIDALSRWISSRKKKREAA